MLRRQGAPWPVFVLAALAIAAVVTLLSAPRTYAERRVDLAARRVLPKAVYKAAGGDADRQAQLLDSARDHELAFECQVVEDKFGPAGTRLLEHFAADLRFQQVLRAYGDRIAPVIVYFMDNDIRSLRALAWVQGRLARFGDGTDVPYATYGPAERGRHAIGAIARNGHRFLGQFAIDAAGKAHWEQTERFAEVFTDFLVGGLRSVETKHDLGGKIGALDVLSASAMQSCRAKWAAARRDQGPSCREPQLMRLAQSQASQADRSGEPFPQEGCCGILRPAALGQKHR